MSPMSITYNESLSKIYVAIVSCKSCYSSKEVKLVCRPFFQIFDYLCRPFLGKVSPKNSHMLLALFVYFLCPMLMDS